MKALQSFAGAYAPARTARAPHLGALKFLSVARTHSGCSRQFNEDHFLNRGDVGLWAVADGMGGHAQGAMASAMIADALAGVDAFTSAYAYRDAVTGVLNQANETLRRYGAENGGGLCGATIVTLLAHQGHFACLWAGDSRAYKLRAGQLKRLTQDHSVVQELIDAGALRSEQAARHRQSNIITRAVGAADSLALDSAHGRIEPGDRFLLCSDGLHSLFNDAEIALFMARAPFEAAADRFIAMALERGAPDNVTVVLIGAEAG